MFKIKWTLLENTFTNYYFSRLKNTLSSVSEFFPLFFSTVFETEGKMIVEWNLSNQIKFNELNPQLNIPYSINGIY